MMNQTPQTASPWLNATALFAWLAVGILGWSALAREAHLPGGVLWLLFGLVMMWELGKGFPWPRGYFLLQAGLTALLLVLGPAWSPFPILFFILSAQAVLRFPWPQAVAWMLGFTALTFVALAWKEGWATALVATPAYAAGYLFFSAFGRALRQAQQARAEAQRLLSELQEAHRRLQAYAEQSAALAVAEERNRMAQEMHDTLGHHLTVAAVQLEAATALVSQEPQRAAALIATVREQIRASLSELRRTVAALRTEVTDLPAALTALAQRFAAATGLEVRVRCDPAVNALPPAVRLFLYRAAQEGLTNIQRHAQARHAWLTVALTDHGVRFTLDDDGIGPPEDYKAASGLGLQGMAAQAQRLGGRARLRTRPEGGARLEILLPNQAGAPPAPSPPDAEEATC